MPESSTPICQHTSQAFSLPSSCPHPHHCPGPAGTAASQATVLTHILPCMGMGSAQVMETAGSCAGRTMLCGTCGEGTTPGCEVPGHGRHWQSHLENSMWGNTATARFQLPGMLQPSEVVDAFWGAQFGTANSTRCRPGAALRPQRAASSLHGLSHHMLSQC